MTEIFSSLFKITGKKTETKQKKSEESAEGRSACVMPCAERAVACTL